MWAAPLAASDSQGGWWVPLIPLKPEGPASHVSGELYLPLSFYCKTHVLYILCGPHVSSFLGEGRGGTVTGSIPPTQSSGGWQVNQAGWAHVRAQPCPPVPDTQELPEPPGGRAGGAAAPRPERRCAVPDGQAAGAAGRADAWQ